MKFVLLVLFVSALVIAGEARKHKFFNNKKWEPSPMRIKFPWKVVMNKTHEICIEFKDRNLFESQNDDDSFNLTIQSEPKGVFETIDTNILAKTKKSCFDLEVGSNETIQGFKINAEARFTTNDTEKVVSVSQSVSFKGGRRENWHKHSRKWNKHMKFDNEMSQETTSESASSLSDLDNQAEFPNLNNFPGKKFKNFKDLIDSKNMMPAPAWNYDNMNEFHRKFTDSVMQHQQKMMQIMDSFQKVYRPEMNTDSFETKFNSAENAFEPINSE